MYRLRTKANENKIWTKRKILDLVIPPASTKLKGGYTGFTLSVCPSVDRIVYALYLQQYMWDPFHISTSYQATWEGVLHVMFVSKFKKKLTFGEFFKFVTLTLSMTLPNRRQAIIWTNADPIHWRIYAALGVDELKKTNLISTKFYTCHGVCKIFIKLIGDLKKMTAGYRTQKSRKSNRRYRQMYFIQIEI